MTKEEKDLLFSDLCSRFPYGVKISKTIENFVSSPHSIRSINSNNVIIEDGEFEDGTPDIDVWDIENVKPYLFPLSSMTEEQKKFFKDRPIFLDFENELVVKEDFFGNSQFTMLDDWMEVILWLLKNHFDWRGLIPKGLAIDCTNLNIYN